MLFQESEDEVSLSKRIVITLNGRSEFTFQATYRPPLTLFDLCSRVESKWGLKVKRLRVFNPEGVEFYGEDLRYLRDSQQIYVSIKGQDFDENSSYGQYEVVRQLGQGGFGRVFLGKHRQTGQLVAIKLMKSDTFNQAGQIDNVFAQAQNLNALSHPNIVQVFKCFALKNMQIVVVMEYMEGGELLKELTSKGSFGEQEAKLYFRQIVNAISYCHSKNIIHRDLKLENILIKTPNSTSIKVVDFGISGVVKEFDPKAHVGTLKYMAPEILSGMQKGTTPGVDIWAMGVILYYMTVSKLPFVGATSAETTRLITLVPVNFPQSQFLSQELKDLIQKLLTKQPKKRIKVSQIKDHPWLKSTSYQRALSNKVEQPNIPRLPANKPIRLRQSLDCLYPKRSPKYNASLGLGSSVSIPKRLEKEKGNIIRELLKCGKGKSVSIGSGQGLRKQATRKGQEKFRKCIIE